VHVNTRTRTHTHTHTHTHTRSHAQGWCGRWRQRPGRSNISKVIHISITVGQTFGSFLASNLLVTTFLPEILEFHTSQLATNLKAKKSIIDGISRVSEGCDGERWGAGVEYHFKKFNEPYAPS